MPSFQATGSRRVIIFISAIALLAGGSIYVFLRPGSFVFHRWLQPVGMEGIVERGNSISRGIADNLPDWLLYSLPDGLWAFAYALLITGIWAGSSSPLRFFWYASIPVLILGFEFLQALEMIPGTFSITDLIFSMGGIGMGIITTMILVSGNRCHRAT